MNRWKGAAEKAGLSLSKFIIENVEKEINSSNDFISKLDLISKVEELEKENVLLSKENKNFGILVDKLQEDLQAYRLRPFLTADYEGVREFEQGLIEIFKKKGFIRQDAIWRELCIKPDDMKAVKAISRQLQALEQYGLVKKTQEGWRWKE